jgi:hypothetical protein
LRARAAQVDAAAAVVRARWFFVKIFHSPLQQLEGICSLGPVASSLLAKICPPASPLRRRPLYASEIVSSDLLRYLCCLLSSNQWHLLSPEYQGHGKKKKEHW